MKHPRYTPVVLIRKVERVTTRTPWKSVEGLLLAIMRMARQHKPLPQSRRKEYRNKWEYVLLEPVRLKRGRRRMRLEK